jgi:hypothetical protein
MNLLRLIRRAATSLRGHIAFFSLSAALPFFLIFLGILYSEDDLTPASAIRLALLSELGFGVGGGIYVWYMITKPRAAKLGRRLD